MSAPLNILTLVLLIVGGLNWGLIGLFGFNLVGAILGSSTILARIVYIAVGASAVVQVALRAGEMSSKN